MVFGCRLISELNRPDKIAVKCFELGYSLFLSLSLFLSFFLFFFLFLFLLILRILLFLVARMNDKKEIVETLARLDLFCQSEKKEDKI
jgi:hypothetical protein